MTDAESIAEIIAASKEAHRNLAELEQELQDEINEIDFFAVCFTPRSGARQHDQRFIPPLEPYRGVGTQ